MGKKLIQTTVLTIHNQLHNPRMHEHMKIMLENALHVHVRSTQQNHNVDTNRGSRRLVLQWPRNHKYSVLSKNDLLNLLSKYGFRVYVWF